MQEMLYKFFIISNYIFKIFFFVFFYLSIKKAFLKEKKGSVKLFFLTLLTNPYLLFVVVLLVTFIIGGVFSVILTSGDLKKTLDYLSETAASSSIIVLFGGFIYTILMISFSYLIGKWLKAHNISLVTFIYLMFSIVNGLSGAITSDSSGKTEELVALVVNVLSYLVLIIATFLLYQLVKNTLSVLTDRKREVNWKMFIIPPAIFLPLYYVLDYLTSAFGGYAANVVLRILTLIILYLFIWAFYVIIKNINATNDAIEAKDEVKTLSVEVMEALAHTIDAKDEYTRGHSVRVAKYSKMLAERLNLSSEECENLYYMALLHDIGKIGVPNEIINSTTKLTDDEYAVIKTHPGVGFDILNEIKSRPDLSIGARWHHERFDGKGYPDGKKGEDIPFYARIIAVADSYDAMTSNRSYRKYMPQNKVRSEIENNMGTQFDSNVAKCMLAIIDEDVNYELHE